MTVATRAISTLNLLRFKRTAQWFQSIYTEGTMHSPRTHWPVTLGFVRWCVDPFTREEIKREHENLQRYATGDQIHSFGNYGGKYHAEHVGRLLKQSHLLHSPLKVLDAACNHGYLVDYLKTPLQRYIGIDLIDEIIATANAEALKRFSKVGCNDYRFLKGDIRLNETYETVPTDNNLIVCNGVLGHFRPKHICQLLDNFYAVLSDDTSSRVIMGCPTIPDDFERHLFLVNEDQFGNIRKVPRRNEGGMRFVVQRNTSDDFEYRRYEIDDLIAFVNNHGGFRIVDKDPKEINPQDGSIYLCLQKK